MADENEPAPPQRTRSPGYPIVDLETAIERAADLSALSQRHPVPLSRAAEVWGFSPRSSNAPKTAAALKRFGFVEDVGDGSARQLRLTQFARELLFHAADQDSPDWPRMLREAALKPKIHRDLLAHFDGQLPDDRITEHYLRFDLHFNEDAARDFIGKLRRTLEFARIDAEPAEQPRMAQPQSPPDFAVGVDADDVLQVVEAQPRAVTAQPYGGESIAPRRAWVDPAAMTRAGVREVSIPYSPSEWATLSAGFPLTEREWRAMTSMLEAMKPGLVQGSPDASGASIPAVEIPE